MNQILQKTIFSIFCLLLILPNHLINHEEYYNLDSSWQIGLNLSFYKGLIFGKDLVFTFGPLGFLFTKLELFVSKYAILEFELFLAFLIISALLYEWKHFNESVIFVLLTVVVLLLLRMDSMFHWIPILFFYFTLRFVYDSTSVHLYLAIFLATISFYIKINYGLVLQAIVLGVVLYGLVSKTLKLIPFMVCLALTSSIHGLFLFTFKIDLLHYIQNGLHIIDAYNDAMFTPIPWPNRTLFFALLSISLYVLIASYFIYKENKNLKVFFLLLITSFYLFLLWKNGFVRADSHKGEFFRMLALPFIYLLLFYNKSVPKLFQLVLLLVLIISLGVSITTKGRFNLNTISLISPFEFNYFKEIFTIRLKEPNQNIKEKFLPLVTEEKKTTIGQASVDIIPWEISELFLNNLNYTPRPIFQSYSAYDYYLDSLNYIKYQSPSAPEYVIYSFGSIDNRHSFWDESITKRALLSNYKLDSIQLNKIEDLLAALSLNCDSIPALFSVRPSNHKEEFDAIVARTSPKCREVIHMKQYENFMSLLLKKRKQPLKVKTLFSKKMNFNIGEKIAVDTCQSLQYLYVNVEYSIWGKLKRLFFQPPPLYVEVETGDGKILKFKAIKKILETGVLINKDIRNTLDAAIFWGYQGSKTPSIKSFRLIGNSGFESSIDATLKYVTVVTGNE